MCDKAVDNYFNVFHSVPIRYKTQEMCDRVPSEDPFILTFSSDRYKTQKVCDETFNYFLTAFKSFPDLFVTSKMIGKCHDALLANNCILFFDEDFSKVTFFTNNMGILGVNLGKINLDDNNKVQVNLKLLFMSDFSLGETNLKNAKH